MAECEDDWADAPCLRPKVIDDPSQWWNAPHICDRCSWPLARHEPFYVRWWRRLTMLGTVGHGRP